MSYPWWRFKVKFSNGAEGDFVASGVTPTDAMYELLDDARFPDTAIGGWVEKEDGIKSVEFLGIDEPDEDELVIGERIVTIE